MKTTIKPIAAAIALALAASPVYALEIFYLAAKQYTKTMPDGTTVPMWGYVIDADNNANDIGDCWQTGDAGRQACIDALPDPVAQTRLTLPVGENSVLIRLSNGLPEPTSLIIPGQELPDVNVVGRGVVAGPTWDDDTTGPRTAAGQRVRSFVAEAPVGGRAVYRWTPGLGNPITGPGTFIFHSGTLPQKQVYMGLSGLITEDSAAGEAYPGVPYDNEVVLFYSDIDPAFNCQVAQPIGNGTCDGLFPTGIPALETAVERHPTWFLINGEPYDPNDSGPRGPAGIPAGAAHETMLLRLASTATDTHVAVLQGLNMTIHAEDGQQYNYQEGAVITPSPRVQYSAMLPPAKTKDATVTAPLDGLYAVYDGNGYMTNPSDPLNESVGDSVGGMLRFLSVSAGANLGPTANDDAVSVVEGFSIGINVLGNDTDPEGDPLVLTGFDATGATGSVACVIGLAGSCTYDAAGVPSGTIDTFTYTMLDQGSYVPAAATVTVTVTPNGSPVANDDVAAADQAGPVVVVDVLANDSDPEGVLSLVASGPTATTLGGSATCTATDCQYTPPAGAAGADAFTYEVSDGFNPNVAATVNVTVAAINQAPTAVDDPGQTTAINTQLAGIDVLANDTDPEATPLQVASFDATSVSNGTVVCNTGVVGGTCTYTPANGFTGSDSFTYFASDGVNTSAVAATVTIEVTGAAAPVLYFSTSGNGSVPGTAGPYDDADVYTVDAGDVYSRLYDAITDLGLPSDANIDGISINGADIYVSFASSSTAVPGLGNVPDEDVVRYDGSTWHAYFDGTTCGLSSNNAGDIDAVSVVGTTLYFSTAGNTNVTGVGGPSGDDADVYTWNGTSCARVLDGSAVGLSGEDIDALSVTAGGDYYISTDSTFNPPGPLNNIGDEAVMLYSGGTWTLYRSNIPGLSGSGSQDVDAVHVP